jgi:O-antigen/teichoic acid export membrane protein
MGTEVTAGGLRDVGRVLRNATSAGQYLLSPLVFALMSRALGADGYGRWWWAFAMLELAGLLGGLGAELHVRRELPVLLARSERDAVHGCVGGALGLAGGVGFVLAAAQIALAGALAEAQRDPGLAAFIALLAVQPVLGNLSGILAAALQSDDDFTPVAVLRGLVVPLVTAAFFAAAWQSGAAASPVLVGMASLSALTLAGIAGLYARRFSLVETLRAALRLRGMRPVAAFGVPLLAPSLLFALGGKLDLFVLGRYCAPAEVGLYGACLQFASALPNLRTVFDPVAQHAIGANAGRDPEQLADSLNRLSRLCAIVLVPPFVVLVAAGEPLLTMLLGRSAAGTALPLAVLATGQLLGGVAVASWLVPMRDRGAVQSAIALVTLLGKAGLLGLLAPRLGPLGAAVATAVGTVIAQQGQAWVGAWRTGTPLTLRPALPPMLVAACAGALGAALLHHAGARLGPLPATALTLLAVGAALPALIALLLTAEERRWCWEWVRARRSSAPAPR